MQISVALKITKTAFDCIAITVHISEWNANHNYTSELPIREEKIITIMQILCHTPIPRLWQRINAEGTNPPI